MAKAYSEHGFYLYPTSFPETGCVALMKALALGAIPITSKHINSTLPELTLHWDMGPEPRRNGLTISEDHEWWKEWVNSVIVAGTKNINELNVNRSNMMKISRKRFLWKTVATTWRDVFTKDSLSGVKKKTLRELYGPINRKTSKNGN